MNMSDWKYDYPQDLEREVLIMMIIYYIGCQD